METANRERGSDLFEIVEGLQQNGKTFESLFNRLVAIGNKLVDDSGSGDKDSGNVLQPANKPSMPGTISSLNNCVTGFTQLAKKFETHIMKLERII